MMTMPCSPLARCYADKARRYADEERCYAERGATLCGCPDPQGQLLFAFGTDLDLAFGNDV